MDDLQENIDIDAEKLVISSLINEGGYKVWLEISDLITPNSFIADTHQVVYKCVNAIFAEDSTITKIGYPLLLSKSKQLKFGEFLANRDEKKYLGSIVKDSVTDPSNIRPLAAKLRKLEVIRVIRQQIRLADEKYKLANGEEKIVDLLGIIEQPILDLSQLIHGLDIKGPKPLFADVINYVEEGIVNPRKFIGLSSGWPAYDKALGGGMRPGTIGVIASRFGQGKTSCGENIAFNVAITGVPVLMLDTEMSEVERWPRDLAMVSGIGITEIEHSTYIDNPEKIKRVREAAKVLNGLKYDYANICGMEFDQVIAIMKHWILTKVGLNSEGVSNPCLIVLDYLKLQSAEGLTKNIAEYMMLGLLTTAFVNFCQKYKAAGLTFAQVNRDGITSEETDVIAGSDRINWFASNCAFMKPQSDEELDEQRQKGISPLFDKKLLMLKTRHGPGLDAGNYIHLRFNRYICKFDCGPTKFDLNSNEQINNTGVVIDKSNPPF